MKETIVPVPFPFSGLNVAVAYDAQPPGTTPDLLNVRGYDPRAGRQRGGQRSGTVKYCPDPAGGFIQDLTHIISSYQPPTSDAGPFTYSVTSGGSVGFASAAGVALATGGTAGDTFTCSCCDESGSFYAGFLNAAGTGVYVQRYSAAGVVAWTSPVIAVTGGDARNRVYGLASDGTLVYVALAVNASTSGAKIYRLKASDGTVFDAGGAAWQTSGTRVYPEAEVPAQGILGVFHTAGSYNNCLAISKSKWLFALETHSTNRAFVDIFDLQNSQVATTFIGAVRSGDALGDVASDGGDFCYFTDGVSNLVKISINRDVQWSIATPGTKAALSVAFDAMGQRVGVVGDTNVLDSGASFGCVSALAGTLVVGTASSPGSVTKWQTVRPNGAGGFVLWRQNAASNVVGLNADLTVGFGPSTLGGSAHVGSAVHVGPPLVTPQRLSSRVVRGLVCANGTVSRFDSASLEFGGIPGGLHVLSPGAQRVASAQQGQRMFYADGLQYAYYDALTDRVYPWLDSLTAGDLPRDNYGYGGRLMVQWRNRMVISGLPYDPLNWFMSRVGDPMDWDYGPAVLTETQPVAGNNSTAGAGQDIVNCLVAYNDEILLFGGDHSLYQMTGDPMAGGRIDLVDDAVGMAFGTPWCRQPDGVLYFVSTHGSVYAFVPGALPQRISDPVSELLLTINIAQVFVRLAWDERQHGFHLFLTTAPTATGIQTAPHGVASTHFFYDSVAKAWFRDKFADDDHNPIAVHVFDGDSPSDRVVLLGSWDQYIRKFEPEALDDDGVAIESRVVCGPLKDKAGQGVTMGDLQCQLDSTSSAVSWSIYAGPDAQTALAAAAAMTGSFSAGRNRSQAVRVFGHAQYVALAGRNLPGQAWALESLRARLRVGEGKARQRIF